MPQSLLEFVGQVVVYGGGATVVAYGVFRFLGQAWIEAKFAEKLESFRHEQAKDLEKARYQINALFDRVSRVHDKEFEVLPEAWGRLQEALAKVNILVAAFRRIHNFDGISEAALNDFLQGSRLSQADQAAMRAATNKTDFYSEKIFWYELNDAKSAIGEFHAYVRKNSIFLSPDLKTEFRTIDDLMWDAAVTREVGVQAKDPKMWIEASKKIRDGAEPILKRIEDLVQERLRYRDAG